MFELEALKEDWLPLLSLPLHSYMYCLQQANLHGYVGLLMQAHPNEYIWFGYICKMELFQFTIHLSAFKIWVHLHMGLDTSPTQVDCGPPPTPWNGSLENYTSTTEGSVVFYSCDLGLVPEGRMLSVCTGSGWSPNPGDLTCSIGMFQCQVPDDSLLHQGRHVLTR